MVWRPYIYIPVAIVSVSALILCIPQRSIWFLNTINLGLKRVFSGLPLFQRKFYYDFFISEEILWGNYAVYSNLLVYKPSKNVFMLIFNVYLARSNLYFHQFNVYLITHLQIGRCWAKAMLILNNSSINLNKLIHNFIIISILKLNSKCFYT